jgi:hypothetical protein
VHRSWASKQPSATTKRPTRKTSGKVFLFKFLQAVLTKNSHILMDVEHHSHRNYFFRSIRPVYDACALDHGKSSSLPNSCTLI